MENYVDDMWIEIFGRLSERDLVPCMSVSNLWHQIASEIWVRRFWVQSPPLGVFFRAAHFPPSNKYKYHMRYISLYNYHNMDDNMDESTYGNHKLGGCRTNLRIRKSSWQTSDREQVADERWTDEYVNGCNGLILLLKSSTNQFYVCNPITGQQVAIPKARVHQNHGHQNFCAALAFDPCESPHHFRVVRIDCSVMSDYSVPLDIYSSEFGLWVRHKLQLDPDFSEGFKTSKICRQFVYLRNKLYSIGLNWNLLCIDLNTVEACDIPLPVADAHKTGAMGCIGESMELLCYMKRMPDKKHDETKINQNLLVWHYDEKSGKWVLAYTLDCAIMGSSIKKTLGFDYDGIMEPYGISPSSDLLFITTSQTIFVVHLHSRFMRLVCQRKHKDPSASFLILRACFTWLHNKRTLLAMPFDDKEILTVELPRGKQEVREPVEVINVSLYDRTSKQPLLTKLVYPSEITDLHSELAYMLFETTESRKAKEARQTIDIPRKKRKSCYF